jgi:hypothetical protein
VRETDERPQILALKVRHVDGQDFLQCRRRGQRSQVTKALHGLEVDAAQGVVLVQARERLHLLQRLQEEVSQTREPPDHGKVGKASYGPELEIAKLADVQEQPKILRPAELDG